MAAPILLNLSHTSHTAARTGIQRVALSLWRHLCPRANAVTYDPWQGAWRALDPWEHDRLPRPTTEAKRRAHWPLAARCRGLVRRWAGSADALGQCDGFIEPELFDATVGRALPRILERAPGPRVAVFHDAVALRHPELSPAGTVARFPAYLQELLAFDGIAAVSAESRDTLLDYWRWLGLADHPPVVHLSPGVDLPPAVPLPGKLEAAPPTVLCVGTLEGRKNHLALLTACETLWQRGLRFELRLIGRVNTETGTAALCRLRELQAAGRPLRYDGPAPEAALGQAYADCAFTVYPSLAEGFGLPVIESLARGKPCVCSARGAVGESAAGGGCLALDSVSAPDLATGIARLLSSPAELAGLAAAARARRFRTWSDYTADLVAWMHSLPRRPDFRLPMPSRQA